MAISASVPEPENGFWEPLSVYEALAKIQWTVVAPAGGLVDFLFVRRPLSHLSVRRRISGFVALAVFSYDLRRR